MALNPNNEQKQPDHQITAAFVQHVTSRLTGIMPYSATPNGNSVVDLISSIDNNAVTLCTRTSEISA